MAKRKRSVEIIRLDELPKKPVPVLIPLECLACGRKFRKAEGYRGLVVYCPNCNQPMVRR